MSALAVAAAAALAAGAGGWGERWCWGGGDVRILEDRACLFVRVCGGGGGDGGGGGGQCGGAEPGAGQLRILKDCARVRACV